MNIIQRPHARICVPKKAKMPFFRPDSAAFQADLFNGSQVEAYIGHRQQFFRCRFGRNDLKEVGAHRIIVRNGAGQGGDTTTKTLPIPSDVGYVLAQLGKRPKVIVVYSRSPFRRRGARALMAMILTEDGTLIQTLCRRTK